jgi:pimeloyl-ACP methyl ester carboxylesterase
VEHGDLTRDSAEPVLHVELPAGGTGPYCLFIHGFLSSRAQWMLNLEPLKQVCQPVVVELWGHGRSPSPQDAAAYSVEGYVAQFESLRYRLGAPHWFVYGQSFGAGLALQYALRHPVQILGVIFTNTNVALSQPDETTRRSAMATALALEVPAEGARQALLKLPMHPRHARRLPPPVMREMQADAEQLVPQAIALGIRHTAAQLYVVDRMEELRMPLVLLNGQFESAFQPLCIRARQRLPAMGVVNLDGGHAVNVECADGCNEAVIGFMRRNLPAST